MFRLSNYPSRNLNSSYTKNAGQTNAFKNPTTPIQKVVAVLMKYIAAPITPRPYTAPDGALLYCLAILKGKYFNITVYQKMEGLENE